MTILVNLIQSWTRSCPNVDLETDTNKVYKKVSFFFLTRCKHILLCVSMLVSEFDGGACQQKQRGMYLSEFFTQLPWQLWSDSFPPSYWQGGKSIKLSNNNTYFCMQCVPNIQSMSG